MKRNSNLTHVAVRMLAVSGFFAILVSESLTAQTYAQPLPPSFTPGYYAAPQISYSNTAVGWNYGTYNGGGQQMIWDNQVLQAELEMTRDQRRELLEMKLDYDERIGHEQLNIQKMQAKVYRLENGQYKIDKDAQKRLQELQQKVAAIRAETKEKAETVLMPHQRELKLRLSAGKMLQQSGFIGLLANPSIQKQMGMDADTQKRIALKRKELEEKLQMEVADFIRKAHGDLIDELDGDSRAMAEELLDQYEYHEKAQGISLLHNDRYFLKKRAEEKDKKK